MYTDRLDLLIISKFNIMQHLFLIKNIQMVKKIIFLFLPCFAFSQVGINTTTPNAALDVNSSEYGFLVPRIDLTSRAVSLPVKNPQGGSLLSGTLVYNTNTSGTFPNEVRPGFYFWDSALSLWQPISYPEGWMTTGNSNINNSSFIGTLNDVNFRIRANNQLVAEFVTGSKTNANSVYLGYGAGVNANYARDSYFIGNGAGYNSTDASNSVYIGSNAGFTTPNGTYNVFIGDNSGRGATNSANSVFLGSRAGWGVTGANNSIFIGTDSGRDSYTATFSNFIGQSAGGNAKDAIYSNSLGFNAGSFATNASYSNFIGWYSGHYGIEAKYSNFLGYAAGSRAENAEKSIFIGYQAGTEAKNASNSIFIGNSSGYRDIINNVSSTNSSILIGNDTNTKGYKNSIAIGTSAENTSDNEFIIGSKSNSSLQYDIVNPKYKNSRDDTGIVAPENYLYTDANGKILSAPLETSKVKVLTGNTSLTLSESVLLVDCDYGDIIIDLPSTVSNGKKYTIKKIDFTNHQLTIRATSGSSIDGNPTAFTTQPNVAFSLVYQGGQWYITSVYPG